MNERDRVRVRHRWRVRNWFSVGIWKLVLWVGCLRCRVGGRMIIGSRGEVVCSRFCLGEGEILRVERYIVSWRCRKG